MVAAGVEPAAFCVSSRCSNQLSYTTRQTVELERIELSSETATNEHALPFPVSTSRSSTPRMEQNRQIFLCGHNVFPLMSPDFPGVHCRFCCQAAAVRPRVPSLVAMCLNRLT